MITTVAGSLRAVTSTVRFCDCWAATSPLNVECALVVKKVPGYNEEGKGNPGGVPHRETTVAKEYADPTNGRHKMPIEAATDWIAVK